MIHNKYSISSEMIPVLHYTQNKGNLKEPWLMGIEVYYGAGFLLNSVYSPLVYC